MLTRRLVRWFDSRLGAARFARTALNKVFPDHWSFMIGEIALYCFVILVLTGTYLTFFFVPDSRDVVYHGSYTPLRGVHMSAAYESTLRVTVSWMTSSTARARLPFGANRWTPASANVRTESPSTGHVATPLTMKPPLTGRAPSLGAVRPRVPAA